MAKEKHKDVIKIRGAKMHNLKEINVDIPKNKLVVITGVSGSGKSSLAFDTLYAEGQRRYVESLSAYARQFLGVMEKPDVEKIEGISPAISISQKEPSHNPRSTVGTMTEIYDYLRVLYARAGVPHCPECGKKVAKQTLDQIVDQIMELDDRGEILILGPVIKGKKGKHQSVLREIQRQGFIRVRVDNNVMRLEEALDKDLDGRKGHSIEVVVDRLAGEATGDRARITDSVETALKLGQGIVRIAYLKNLAYARLLRSKDIVLSERFACEKCSISLPPMEPRLFSFNSPFGACPECQGLGYKLEPVSDLIIPDKTRTLAQGAIAAWSQASHRLGRQGYFWHQLNKLSQRYGFSMASPVRNLSSKIQNIILYGDEGFEGVITQLKRRYQQTNSQATRSEIKKYMRETICPACKGARLRKEALSVTIDGWSIDQVVSKNIETAKEFFENFKKKLSEHQEKIALPLLTEIISRLDFLLEVGVGYLTLARPAGTLAGGETMRVRLATQIGSKLTGVLYILDEPSIGLHARDQARLIKTLKNLRDLGNTVVVVEHDPQTIKTADWVIDIGPQAGKHGGKVVFQGLPRQLLKANTLTGQYLSGKKRVIQDSHSEAERQQSRSLPTGQAGIPCSVHGIRDSSLRPSASVQNDDAGMLIIKGATEHNLKNIDVQIPLNKFVCVTGVSGSGKSTLVDDILSRALKQEFYGSKNKPGAHKSIKGMDNLDRVVLVDQSPIGRTPRSNPATYTKIFDYIRDLFAKTREARLRGYKRSRFSFNVKGGRCEACEGQGQNKIEMYFLPDVYVMCQECKGTRFNKETLEIEYNGKNIAEVLEMTIEEALRFFSNIPGLKRRLRVLNNVGLGYIELGQPATSLSGGEAQRIKLARELSRQSLQTNRNTLYILDEPTTGLHPHDIKRLVQVLHSLVKYKNTVLAIEHNLDFIASSDWVIDLGPEGGEGGGYIVAQGPPLYLAKTKNSPTSEYLCQYFKNAKVLTRGNF